MESILNELTHVQGLTGAYIYQAPGTILQNILPPIFKPARLLSMGKALTKIHGAGALNFPDLSDVILSFDESTVITRSIAEKTWLIILGEPDVNVNMVTLSVNLLLDDFKGSLELAPGADSAGFPIPEAPAATTKVPAPSSKDLLEHGLLAADLQAMQGALAKVIGPMAKIIFLECLEKWLQRNAPSREKLPALTDLVLREIADPEKAVKYQNMLEALP
ncbi:MAG: hypothetical protein IPP78_03225 [Holophagaceae bacterium]|nr:hypothetical protein [Holophagaceae bacterium]